MTLWAWAALLRRSIRCRRRSPRPPPAGSLNLQLGLHAATLRQIANLLDRMTTNVISGQPSVLLMSAALINADGEEQEDAGHFTLKRAAEDLEYTAECLRRAAGFERKVLDERGHAALLERESASPRNDDVDEGSSGEDNLSQ